MKNSLNLVSVRKSEDGTYVHSTKNPDIGYVIYESSELMYNNGWLDKKILSALILAPKDLLDSMDHSKPLPGKIVVREQLEPINAQDLTYKLKYAGDTGIVCMHGDSPIYRTTEYTPDTSVQSVLIKHTNGAEIRQANSNVAVDSLETFKQETVEA
tara:strand:- start:474 stop:941 length:468 start_codon:yes stop_codon:yes gene_type:complete